jgi:hypothetical protein
MRLVRRERIGNNRPPCASYNPDSSIIDRQVAMTHSPTLLRRTRVAALLVLAVLSVGLQARHGELPYSLAHRAKVGVNLPIEDVRPIDAAQKRMQLDQHADPSAPHTKRLQVAENNAVSITPQANGVWETLADGSRLWRVRVRAAGATDLRLGFEQFALPPGATLYVIGADDYYQGPYLATDVTGTTFNAPAVPGDTATIELRIPADSNLAPDALRLTRVGAGFRDLFGRAKADSTGPGTSGACNVNVICPLGQPYPNEIRAVGYYEFQADADHGYYICTGTLLADVPRDRKNYFLTAAHCVASNTETASMVIYWNYQSTQCAALAAPAGGFLADDLHGATLRASRADADFSLVELTQSPQTAWNPYYAGWDASGTVPSGTIGLHHPSGDVKKITAGPAPATTSNCIASGTTSSTHWLTGPYSQGTTEGGSSGSGLFAPAADGSHAKLLIGTLSGGGAACSSISPGQPNSENDCYGKFAAAWNGASSSTRLRDWLDPANTGALSLQGGDGSSVDSTPRHSTHAIPAILLNQSRHR